MRFLLPLAILSALVVFLGLGLLRDPGEVPSPLIDKPAPAFELPTLQDSNVTLTRASFGEHPVSLFNVWASWCVACRQEHPLLMELAREDAVPIYGLNYKDEGANARAWLERYGNPYRASAVDRDGKVGIDWGVYGVPETYIVDRYGIIRYKHIGPITARAWQETMRPLIERLRSEAG